MTEQKIRILVTEGEEVMKAARPSLENLLENIVTSPPSKVLELEVGAVAKKVASTFSTVVELLYQLPPTGDRFQVEEVTFSLAVDSKGEVSVVSTVGGSVGTQVGLTFTLSRK